MGLTSALNTSVNGLALNETSIDVLGNNIANAGTNGFKASKVLFQTQLTRTMSVGSRPTSTNGGTNPQQIGLGAATAAITTDFSQGSITNSTNPSDLAIEGDGFFIVAGADGNAYSRAGNFKLNSQDLLVDPSGFRVQGYAVDDDYNLITTQLTNISIPIGDLNVAQQTNNIEIGGAVLSTGNVSTQGSLLTSNNALTSASGSDFATDPVDGTTLLTDVYQEGSTTPLFTNGDVLTFAPRKGGRVMEPQTLTVSSSTTMQQYMTFMNNVYGIQSGGGIPQDGGVDPGISISSTGHMEVRGNRGSVNDVTLTVGDLTKQSGGGSVSVDFPFTKTATADGESSSTEFVVYDSLGQAVDVRMISVLESRDNSGSTFRYYLESNGDSDASIAVSNGTLKFDSNGKVSAGAIQQFSIDRLGTGAVSPMQINIDFSSISGISAATAGSNLTLQTQDGSSPGTLSSYVIDDQGVINGVFDNGITRTLGQIVLARFSNPQGLVANGSTTYKEGVASGPPFLVTPGTFGAGTIRSGATELSNTDIGQSLVDLIVASTNYRGNARVIDSVQQLTNELLSLGR
jgi:flagellar hook protein FlgE